VLFQYFGRETGNEKRADPNTPQAGVRPWAGRDQAKALPAGNRRQSDLLCTHC